MAEFINHDGTDKTKRTGSGKSKNELINMLTEDINNPGSKEIESLPVNSLIPYHEHPFKLYEGERLSDMVRSIKELGVLLPIIVRPLSADNETFEILSGHNRANAAKTAGLSEVPVVIKYGLTDDEAKLIVTETNLVQRSFADLSHSERAIALKYHMESISKQGKRTDLINEIKKLANTDKIGENSTSYQFDTKSRSNEKTGEKYGLSSASVARYIRITYLISPLQNRVDSEEIPFISAVTISYLSSDEQHMLNSILDKTAYKISLAKAEVLRGFSEDKRLTNEKIEQILLGRLDKKPKPKSLPAIKIKHKIYAKYFHADTKQSEIEATIDKALAEYFNNHNKIKEDI